jgi:hypothetical protein
MPVNGEKVFASMPPKGAPNTMSYYLVQTYSPKPNTIPKYGLVETDTLQLRIPLTVLAESKDLYAAFKRVPSAKRHTVSIEDYLSSKK